MARIIYIVAFIVAIVCGVYYYVNFSSSKNSTAETVYGSDYKSIAYRINGSTVKLENGVSQTTSGDGASQSTVTKYFGNEAVGDINADGMPDTAFLLTQNTGGSGTFFYLVAALKQSDGRYNGTEAVYIGDRIAPQNTEIRNGNAVVNYADRAPGESMTASPSMGKSLVLHFDPVTRKFGELVQGFEGEADPSRMSLSMKTWTWIEARYSDGKILKPGVAGSFELTISGNKFTSTTDCNSLSGVYIQEGNALSFSNIAMTKKYCEGSQEADFVALLQDTDGFHFTSKGELVLELKTLEGAVTFK